ncbi:MAG: metallophosphoesterase family protein [Acidobacteriaceae bacterium]
MRIAVVSDVHGNGTALEAVIADLREATPDLVLHGGDLADGGSSPMRVVDRIGELGWLGVMGNTDEMLVRPQALEDFAAQSKAPAAMWEMIREIAAATRTALGEARLAWLGHLPATIARPELAVVHARPGDCWRAPAADASDTELEAIYGGLGKKTVAYGHTHLPSIRKLGGTPKLLINTGSVGLPYDGDARASYLLLDEGVPEIRRVEYDVEKELALLAWCGLPGAAWTAKMLRARGPTMP